MTSSHKVFVHILVSLLCCPAYGQALNGSDYRNAVKLNLNYTTSFGNGFHVGNVAPVWMHATKRNNFHELELNTISVRKSVVPIYDVAGQQIGNTTIHARNFGLRYQFTYSLIRKGMLIPQIGLSLMGLYQSNHNIPGVSSAFERRTRDWETRLAISPQVRYEITTRCFIDVAIPFNMMSLSGRFQKIDNPAIPVRQQKNAGYEFDDFPGLKNSLHIRVGGGIKF